jgi:hypothetical protein
MIVAWILLSMGCSPRFSAMADKDAMSEDAAAGDTGVMADAEGASNPRFLLQIEPPAALDDEAWLPQTFGPFADGDGFELALTAPVRARGRVRAEVLQPWSVAPLPTREIDVSGEMYLTQDAAPWSPPVRVILDAEGAWEADLLPGTWRAAVRPDRADVAAGEVLWVWTEDGEVSATLDAGVALWGRLLDADGAPVAGAAVYAEEAPPESPFGAPERPSAATATGWTDAEGWYLLRVQAGDRGWRVITTGADPRLPSLRSGWIRVPPEGARTDLAYPVPADARLSLRLTDAGGSPLADLPLRLVSRSLDGYAADTATFEVELSSDSRGAVLTQLPAGIYDAEVLPGPDREVSGWRVSGLVVGAETRLGDVALPPLVPKSGFVTDSGGVGLAGASVQIVETSSAPRSWDATSDGSGAYRVDVPGTAFDLAVRPPGDRPDLAAVHTRQILGELPFSVALRPGEPVSGTVLSPEPDARPVAYAVVRCLDEAGEVYGYGLTDADGRFTLRVDWGEP